MRFGWISRYVAGVGQVFHLLEMRTDIARLMAALDLLASPFYGEEFSNVLGETMACGVPCVVTDVGDSAFIVNDTRHVVPSGDMENFSTAMQVLIELPARERATFWQHAKAHVVENFEIFQIVHRYEAFYEELVERSHSRGVERTQWR